MIREVGALTKADIGTVVAVEYTTLEKPKGNWRQKLNPLAERKEVSQRHVVRGIVHDVRQVTCGGTGIPWPGEERTSITFTGLEKAVDPTVPTNEMAFKPVSANKRTKIAPNAVIDVALPAEPFFMFSFSRSCVAHLMPAATKTEARS